MAPSALLDPDGVLDHRRQAARPGGGMAAGQADTPRFTVAMVTHGPPGDTFWDLIRKGAETAAAKDNIELKYSAELQGPDKPTSSRTPSTARSTRSPSRWPSPKHSPAASNPQSKRASRSWPSTQASTPGRHWA